MGLTYVDAEVKGAAHQGVTVRFLVDSGASYSLLPEDIWKRLDLKPKRAVTAALADGTMLKRSVSECTFIYNGHEGASPVLLGEPGDEPLLGVITLENLGFVLNPYKRTIEPMRVRF